MPSMSFMLYLRARYSARLARGISVNMQVARINVRIDASKMTVANAIRIVGSDTIAEVARISSSITSSVVVAAIVEG